MERSMDMEKNIINMDKLNLKENIKMEKNGMEKDLMKMVILYMN